MHIIKRGAEAILYIDEYDGQKVLVKERVKKSYRIAQIDEKIRKTRTKKEVKLMTSARSCSVMTPKILAVDENGYKIIMEHVDGKTVKELFYSADRKTVANISKEIGRLIGKLHNAGIVHGDLTTSNMIVAKDSIYFIDFGLGEFSKRIEGQGVDLNLLAEALKSTHFKLFKLCWSNIVKGYKQEYKFADDVLEKVDEIEKRARYAKRQ